MADPIMLAVAAAIARKAVEAAFEGGRKAWEALVRVVRDRLAREPEAKATLDAAQSEPENQERVQALAVVLERIAAGDAAFDSQLRTLWAKASLELSASDGGVVNSNTGTVGGHLIQGRDFDIKGGLRLGDVPPQRKQ